MPCVFKNGDRVRIDADKGEVVHIRSGQVVEMLPHEEGGVPNPGSPSKMPRVVLKGLREKVGETIDLAEHAEPPVPSVRFKNPEEGDAIDVLKALAKLPTGKDAASRAARRKLFASMCAGP